MCHDLDDKTYRVETARVLDAAAHEAPRERGKSNGLRLLQCITERLIEGDVPRVDCRMRDAKDCASQEASGTTCPAPEMNAGATHRTDRSRGCGQQ